MPRPTVKGTASQPVYGHRETEIWTCDGCGRTIQISVPARKTAYPHTACPNHPRGDYRP